MTKFIKTALYALVLAWRGPTLYAQAPLADTIPVNTFDLREVVISVNKTQETKRNVAQQVQTITMLDLIQMQAQSTADVLANSGSVFVQKSQMGGGSITLRGLEANRNLLVIDGVRMNNLIYRSGHLQNIVTTDNNALERIEILFGPASTVYGSDALGGVVHLYTRKPQISEGDEPLLVKANTLSRYGSVNNELTNHFNLNIGTQKFASFTAVTYSNFGDLKGGTQQNPFYTRAYGLRPYYVERIEGRDSLVKNSDPYLQVQSGYTQYDLMQKFLVQQNQHLSHGLNIQYSNSSNVPRYDRLTDASADNGLRFAEWYYGPQTRLLTAYDLNYNKATGFFQTVHVGANYQYVEESRHTRRFGTDDLTHRTERVEILGANLNVQRVVNRHNIRLGLDGQYNTLRSTANSENIVTNAIAPLDTRYPSGKNIMANAALYLSHTWKISDRWSLLDGFRLGFVTLHSTFRDTSFFKFPFSLVEQSNFVWSGNVGIIHNLKDWKLSALLSTGFRAPNVDDLGKVFESTPGLIIVPNPDLRPERTINTEIGITKVINKRTRWENTLYYTQFLDAIITNRFQYNGQDSITYEGSRSQVFANQNKRKAYIYGFSSALQSQLNTHFSLSMSISYTYGRINTDDSNVQLDHIPPFMSRVALSYAHEDFNAEFIVNYNGWKRLKDYAFNGEDNEQYATPEGMPAWLIANVRAGYRVNSYIKLQVGVDNIFDTQYRTFASGINAPGRNIFGALRLSLAHI